MAGERILIADDDPIILSFLSALLKDKGYQVITAEDGERTLQAALIYHPEVIVTDLVMPYMDGFEIIRTIRRENKLKDTPIIILSMKDKEDDIVKGLEEGADDYIVKPFNALELVTRIKKLLERSKRKK
ncbi:MAG: response regulator [Acidobacteriota bacterium]